jgi:hypothetical protein
MIISWTSTREKRHVTAGEREAREGVRGESAQDELRREDHGDEGDRIDDVAREGRRVPRLHEVLQGQRRRQDELRGVLLRVERRPHRVEERQDPQHAEEPGGSGLQPWPYVHW